MIKVFSIFSLFTFLIWGCKSEVQENKSNNPYSGSTHLKDSLNWEIQNSNSDTVVFNSYKAFFESYACVHQDTAKLYLDSMKTVSLKNSEVSLPALYLLSEGDFFDCDSKIELAEKSYIKAIELLLNSDDDGNLSTAYNNLGYVQNHLGKDKEAIDNYKNSLEIKENNFDSIGIATTLSNIGYVYDLKGDAIQALKYYNQSLEIRKLKQDKYGMASCYNNIAYVYQSKGDIPKAVDYFRKAVRYFEELNDDGGLSVCYNNIGILYLHQKDYQNSIDYFQKSLNLIELTDDKESVATTKNNIGSVYFNQGKYDKSLKFFREALKYLRLHGDHLSQAGCLTSIGNCLIHSKSKESPFAYFNEALTLYKSLKNNIGISEVNEGLSSFFSSKGNQVLAKKHALIAYELNKKTGFPDGLKSSSLTLYKIYKSTNEYQKALKHHEIYITMREKIENETNQNAVLNSKFQIAYERQAAADSVKIKADKELVSMQHQAELSEEENKKYILYGGLSLMLMIAFISIFAFLRKKKDNRIIENQKIEVEKQRDHAKNSQFEAVEQKLIVEEKNREIVDSIRYAKRLQNAILPNKEVMKNSFTDLFILYQPKDIVAGDFYWFENIESEDTIYIAVADCTGHGVPGAMVSVVCSSALTKAVMEEGIRKPSDILERVTEIVVKTFDKSDDHINDGMDIGICKIQKKHNKLEFAGANIPLIKISRKNGQPDDLELSRIRGSKRPVGKHKISLPFENNSIDLTPNDAFYMYSDGYADQFGGENHDIGKVGGKKLKSANLRKLIMSIQEKEFEDQQEYLEVMFEKWKGSLEQIDDVCIIGFKLM